MSTEKQKRTEIEVSFYIRDAEDIPTSDFNTIILRLQELRDSIESTYHSKLDVEKNNHNIKAIQSLLDNFKFKILKE